MCIIEDKISKFMFTCSKFEYFVINEDTELGKIGKMIDTPPLQKIVGLDWKKLAKKIKINFEDFNFGSSGFEILKEEPPQFLVKAEKKLKWDSDNAAIDSWEKLLTRSFAQLRNNIAHGNKAHMPSQFTQDRTEKFIDAGNDLIKFIAKEIFGKENWESSIIFK